MQNHARRGHWAAYAAMVVGCASLSACLVRGDRCGKDQEPIDGDFIGCICVDGTVPAADGIGCEPCPENEVAAGIACVCAAGYARTAGGDCAPSGDGGVEALPEGQGEPCNSSADCAGFEATFCDTLQSNSCLVRGCVTGENSCLSSEECCDLSIYPVAGLAEAGGLCIPQGLCDTAGGSVVEP